MVVVKVGGSAGIDYANLCDDLAKRWAAGERLVLVHGGSAATNQLAETVGHPPRFVTSPSGYTSRYTDRRTLEIFLMAAGGLLNKTLVESLQRRGVNALGLSGLERVDRRGHTALEKEEAELETGHACADDTDVCHESRSAGRGRCGFSALQPARSQSCGRQPGSAAAAHTRSRPGHRPAEGNCPGPFHAPYQRTCRRGGWRSARPASAARQRAGGR